MSCNLCKDAQRYKDINGSFLFRWKNANIEIIACDAHTREIVAALLDVKEADEMTTKFRAELDGQS